MAVDDLYFIVQAKMNRLEAGGKIAKHVQEITGYTYIAFYGAQRSFIYTTTSTVCVINIYSSRRSFSVVAGIQK